METLEGQIRTWNWRRHLEVRGMKSDFARDMTLRLLDRLSKVDPEKARDVSMDLRLTSNHDDHPAIG